MMHVEVSFCNCSYHVTITLCCSIDPINNTQDVHPPQLPLPYDDAGWGPSKKLLFPCNS